MKDFIGASSVFCSQPILAVFANAAAVTDFPVDPVYPFPPALDRFCGTESSNVRCSMADNRLAIGAANSIWEFHNLPAVCKKSGVNSEQR